MLRNPLIGSKAAAVKNPRVPHPLIGTGGDGSGRRVLHDDGTWRPLQRTSALPPEPIDVTSDIDAMAFYPVSGGGTAALVQSGVALASGTQPTPITVTLDDPVTGGNLLVALGVARSRDSIDLSAAGWTILPSVDANPGIFGNGGAGALAYKIAEGTEGDEITINVPVTGSVQRRLVVAEFSGPNDFHDHAPTDEAAAGTTHTTDSLTPPAGLPALLIAAGIQASSGSQTLTVGSGYTLVSAGGVAGGSGPYSLLQYRAVDPTSGSYTADINSSAAGNMWASDLVAFVGIAERIWVPAPRTIDGDDSTYHEIIG